MLSTSGSRATQDQARPPADATSLQDISNTKVPSDQSHESTAKDSMPDRPSSSFSALSLRHLKQEDTPLPAKPLPSETHGPARQSTQPTTSDSDPVKYKYSLPLLQLDAPEDHMTCQRGSPIASQTDIPCGGQPQSSTAKQSVHQFPLLTLNPPEEEDLHMPSVTQSPQLHSPHTTEHTTLPLLQCHPPRHALVDIGVGRSAPAITTQLSPCFPNIPGVTGVAGHVYTPTIPLVLTKEKLPTLPPPPPPPPLPPPPPPTHALIRLHVPTNPERIQLLPLDVLLCNQPPGIHMGGRASMELLQLPKQSSETVPHVPLIQSVSQKRGHGRTACNR